VHAGLLETQPNFQKDAEGADSSGYFPATSEACARDWSALRHLNIQKCRTTCSYQPTVLVFVRKYSLQSKKKEKVEKRPRVVFRTNPTSLQRCEEIALWDQSFRNLRDCKSVPNSAPRALRKYAFITRNATTTKVDSGSTYAFVIQSSDCRNAC